MIAAGLVFLPRNGETDAILIGAAVIALVGAADDLLELSADFKIIGQILAAVIPVASGVRVENLTLPFIGPVHLSAPVSYTLTVIGIVALMNVLNFIDGVDGLAAGVCTIGAATFAAIALSLDRNAAGVLALIVVGATLGYLRQASPPPPSSSATPDRTCSATCSGWSSCRARSRRTPSSPSRSHWSCSPCRSSTRAS